jgi:hypothetical protein
MNLPALALTSNGNVIEHLLEMLDAVADLVDHDAIDWDGAPPDVKVRFSRSFRAAMKSARGEGQCREC